MGALAMADDAEVFDQESYIAESKAMRLKHLEEQAMFSLKIAVENYGNAVFPNALIAGDAVITHLLHRMGYLADGRAKVMVVDTFHLFPETMEFMRSIEEEYGFKAEVFCAEGVPVGDKAAYDAKYGANLWREDIEQYDKVCKVEPFQRGLKECGTDCMINGRTRWQGFERAWIDQFENAPIGGGLAKCNPLAYWTLEDTFDYIAKYTIPIPEDGSTKFVDFKFEGDKTPWLDYASERKGRFVGLANKDGSTKTECGIHVAGAEQTFDRDLWEDGAVKTLASNDEALALLDGDEEAVVVVYAPWCQFCQGMEDALEEYAKTAGVPVYKFRGDEERVFVQEKLNTESFPTVNFVKGDGSVVKYDSEARSAEDFAKFEKSFEKATA